MFPLFWASRRYTNRYQDPFRILTLNTMLRENEVTLERVRSFAIPIRVNYGHIGVLPRTAVSYKREDADSS
jgi:hypothetical protein